LLVWGDEAAWPEAADPAAGVAWSALPLPLALDWSELAVVCPAFAAPAGPSAGELAGGSETWKLSLLLALAAGADWAGGGLGGVWATGGGEGGVKAAATPESDCAKPSAAASFLDGLDAFDEDA
jgi:hypothetical protein